MSIRICEYQSGQVEAVRQFNQRLMAGGETAQFPLSPISARLPKIAGRKLFDEYYLATDQDGVVRGGYILQHRNFWLKNRTVRIADFQLPISEGVVKKSYCQVGGQLLRDALARQPLLYGLGMGGYGQPVARLLQIAGWRLFAVPFFFRVVHPQAFLRNLTYLRRRASLRFALDATDFTGLGWVAVQAVQRFRGRDGSLQKDIAVKAVDEFSSWADDLWEKYKGQYGLLGVRDAESLRILYPKHERRFIRLEVSERSRLIGWAVLLNTPLKNHKYFGNMRLGTIVGTFGDTWHATTIITAARTYLESEGVDLIVSNQAHAVWCRALREAGFLRGPSNFIFAGSTKLMELLDQEGVQNSELHFTRGDGDGPINL
jgi:hypothetical protein